MTPFVGRAHELRLLWDRWERVARGRRTSGLIAGEAGIGKSRLMHHFREGLAATPYTWIDAASAPFFQNMPFYPVADMFHQGFIQRVVATIRMRRNGRS